jgi:hypothetical protein
MLLFLLFVICTDNGGKITEITLFKTMKYHKNKEAWITTTIFTQFLKVLDDSTDVKCGNILFVGNCAAHPQDMSFL